MIRARFPISFLVGILLAGCSLPEQGADLDARDPTSRSLAALEAVDEDDRRAIPALIGMLESSDPALRLIAAESLERMTGKNFGYDATASEGERLEAVERWVMWWESGGSAAPADDMD